MKRKDRVFVSVIMPVYNRESVVSRAIESVLQQTYTHFELIIVDDGSTDNTLQTIQTFTDSRIRTIRLSKRKGAPAARNIGIQQAKGDWMAFQDSDDVWHKEKLEKQVNHIPEEAELLPIIYTSFCRHKHGQQTIIPSNDGRNKQGFIHKELLWENFISTQTVLMHKQCIERAGFFAEDMPRFQDWELWLRISQHYPFIWVNEPLVDVYYSEQSISADQMSIVHAYEKILEKHQHLFQRAGSKYYAHLLFSYGHNLCLAGNVSQGRNLLFKSWRCDVLSYRSAVSFIASLFGKRFYHKTYSYLKHNGGRR